MVSISFFAKSMNVEAFRGRPKDFPLSGRYVLLTSPPDCLPCDIMIPSRACKLEECASGCDAASFIPKWKIRVCYECRSLNHDGMHTQRREELIRCGVPPESIEYLDNGLIRVPHPSELP